MNAGEVASARGGESDNAIAYIAALEAIGITMTCQKDNDSPAKRATPDWRLIEQAVRTLEQSLDPDAVVTHNEWLREMVTGTARQCDVVIRSGPRYRRTMTIVEVQRRKGK